jgi:hypothetical protein
VLLLAISIAHVSEDFAYGVPARFGAGILEGAAVIGLLYIVQASAIVAAARGTGYLVNAAIGAGWSIAALVDHLGEILFADPYRQGYASKGLEIALVVAGAVLFLVSVRASGARRASPTA